MSGWIGVDLDGTLAVYDGWRGVEHIGEPIAPMVERVRKWVAEGMEVRIFTARVDCERVRRIVQDWSERHIGVRLAVTNVKDKGMIVLYDDRCIQVERNTGRLTTDVIYERGTEGIAEVEGG